MKIHFSLKTAFVLSAALVCLASGLQAQEKDEPISPDRPDFTQGTQIVEKGRFQVESGVTFERHGDARQTTLGEVLLRLPLAQRAEIRFGVPSYLVVRENGRFAGLDDALLSAKFRLTGPQAKTALAILAETTLPTGSRRVAERRYQPDLILAAEKEAGKMSLAANLGLARPVSDGQRFSQVFAGLSAGFDFSKRLDSFLEVYALNREEPGGPSQKFADAGLGYLLNNDTQIDARVGFGINNHSNGPDYFYGAGISRRF